MAKLKTPVRTSVPSRAGQVKPMPLDWLLSDDVGDRPGPADPETDAVWLALRSEIYSVTLMGPFDLRELFHGRKDHVDVARWREERRAFLSEHFKNDSRVIVD